MTHWNEWNIAHVATHNVSPDEADDVLAHAMPPYPQRRADDKYMVRGQTEAGRYLPIIFVYRSVAAVDITTLSLEQAMMLEDLDNVVYVIHARDLNRREIDNLRIRRRSS